MKLFLVLGCWGKEEDDFIMCPSVSNKILDLSKSSERNREIIEFLDGTYRLCDKPLYNNVHTALFGVQDKFSNVGKPVFTKIQFYRLENFCQLHAKCGLYLRLELEEGE